MSKKMLVNATQPEENRVAIVEDGILTELDIEVVGREQTKGNIYKATVVRVEPGLQAAFVDFGAERLGFLQMGEIHPSFFKAADPDGSRKGKLRINDILRRGQEFLVQVVKGARGTKGAALTTHLSLAGRYMVLMPESDSKGVSRKIEEDSIRKKLKSTMNSLDLPENMGYIVRTAGIDQTKEELKRDFDYLVRVYENILALAKKAKAPALIYKESNLVIRSIRDYFTPDIDEVLVDDLKVAQEAKDFLAQVMPECVRLVKLHQEKRPIFSRYQIEEQIETISKNKVPLPSGGSIVIDRTEALVAIDVNSGKLAGEQGIEATALRTNLEAADEAARQLRLRDLGGLIVIDFIDMRERKHNREVEKRLKDALKYDKAKVSIGKISDFGLLEMSRQRIRDALAEGTFLVCPHCEGSGRIKSPEAQAAALLRKIQAGIAKGQIARVETEIPHDAAAYLLNAKRGELLELERRNGIEVQVLGRSDLVAGQVEITFVRREKEDDLYLPPVTAIPEPLEARPSLPREEAPALPAAPAPAAATPPAEEETPVATRKKRSRKAKPVPVAESEVASTSPAPAVAPASAPRGEAPEDAQRLFGGLIDESEEEIAEDAGDEESAAVGDVGITSADGVKKKRRRRRKKKKTPQPGTASEDAGTVATAQPSTTEPGTAPETAGTAPEPRTEPGTPTDEKQKKSKRKRKRKKKTPSVTEGQTADTGAVLPAESPTVVAKAAEPLPETVTKASARKRKPKTEPGITAAATAEPAPLPPLAAELIASLHPEMATATTTAKPSRKGRKAEAPGSEASAEAPAPAVTEAPPSKPARKRAVRPVPTPGPGEGETSVTAAVAPKAPKPSRTRKTAPDSTAASPAPMASETPAPRARGRKAKTETTE